MLPTSPTPSGRPSLLRAAADLLVPPRCPACGARGDVAWCPTCRAAVGRPVRPCPRCASTDRSGSCWPRGVVDRTAAAWDYRGPVAEAVVAAKVRGARASWVPLCEAAARELRPGLPPPWVGERPVVLVPVPADPRRRRARGFDHTGEFAAALGEVAGLPVARHWLAVGAGPSRAAVRARAARSPRRWRPARAGSARMPHALQRLPPVHGLLVDDVVTTGATVLAAAGALRRAGVATVDAVVMARAASHRRRRDGPPHPPG